MRRGLSVLNRSRCSWDFKVMGATVLKRSRAAAGPDAKRVNPVLSAQKSISIPLGAQVSGTAGAATLFIGKLPGFFKNFHEHRARELSGLGVLVRRVIRGQQGFTVRQLVAGSVPETVLPFARDDA